MVEVIGGLGEEGLPGVECLNPGSPLPERKYRKEFRSKRIFLPHEYDIALAELLSAHNSNFVLSMNGYSRITRDQCRRYGVEPGAYEHACKAILRNAVRHLNEKLDTAKVLLIDGASDMGVDAAIAEVALKLNVPSLGFSCPRYMLHVPDDERAVFVAKDSEDYADYYVRSLDLLLTTGGREQVLKHDVLAACLYNKRIHVVDVLNMLSSTGGVSATITDESGKVTVENAAAAFGRNITFFTTTEAVVAKPAGGDIWDAVFNNVASIATETCRRKMPPELKFSK